MNRKNSHAFQLIVLLAIVILVAGCSSADQDPSAENAQPDRANDSPGSVLAPPGDGLSLDDPAAGLPGLSAYLATLTLQFDGSQDSETMTWSRTYQLRVSRSGEAFRQLEIQSLLQEAGGNPTSRLITENGNFQYQVIDQQACTATAMEQATPLEELWELATFLPALRGGQAAGEEMIEGILARQVTFDELSLGQAELTDSTGQVWLIDDNGIVLRYSLVQSAPLDFFGEGLEGTLRWEYQLSEINQPQPLSLPEGCQPPLVLDVPLPSDARNVSQSDRFLDYKTSLEEVQILDFHRQSLEGDGWQLVDGSAFSELGADGFDFGDFDMSGFDSSEFDEEGFDWSEFDPSQFDDDSYTDEEYDFLGEGMDSSLSDTSTQGIYLFKRENEKLTVLVLQDGDTRSVTISLTTGEDTPE